MIWEVSRLGAYGLGPFGSLRVGTLSTSTLLSWASSLEGEPLIMSKHMDEIANSVILDLLNIVYRLFKL